ncbi:MAG TPA: magnesium/cobalt efflux protein [Porticoccaceae bacterium]|nr:magnesium/cobalt efflux protein [Porticoccaceae bacterium]HCO58814.1 magnesium/cobalt efflux protein [Porticoccaceae bacterium]
MNDAPLWLLSSLLVCLLLFSAFFSSSETGMMSLNRYRLKHLAKRHSGARRARRLLERPDRLIGIILIGNNAVNILASITASIICTRLFGPEVGIAVATVSLTLLLLIFAEVTPKTIAALHPEQIAFPASHVLKPLLKVCYPLVWLVNHMSNALVRLLGFNPYRQASDSLSSEELRTVVDESEDGDISNRDQNMLLGILDLERVTVNHIMVPRNEIVSLNLEDDLDQLIDQIVKTEHTRLPVHSGNLSELHGFLHMRRVNRLLRGGEESLTKEAIKRFARDRYYVPARTPLNLQLINFQKNRLRVGLVVDEYGEVEGLVTLDDILEEIVGEFTTNLVPQEDEIAPQADGSYIIDASVTLLEINRATDWELPIEGPTTLNGLLLEHLESFPDGKVSIQLGSYYFEVLAMTEKMITTLKAWGGASTPTPGP